MELASRTCAEYVTCIDPAACTPPPQDVSLTSKYDNSHHCLPEPLLALPSLRQLLDRFPSLTGIQNDISRLTTLEVLRVEGLQGTLIIEPGGEGMHTPIWARDRDCILC